jgi:hypothetical protein
MFSHSPLFLAGRLFSHSPLFLAGGVFHGVGGQIKPYNYGELCGLDLVQA